MHSGQGRYSKEAQDRAAVVLFIFIQINTTPVQSLIVSSQAGVFGFSDMQWHDHMTVLELTTSAPDAQAQLALRREGGEVPWCRLPIRGRQR